MKFRTTNDRKLRFNQVSHEVSEAVQRMYMKLRSKHNAEMNARYIIVTTDNIVSKQEETQLFKTTIRKVIIIHHRIAG